MTLAGVSQGSHDVTAESDLSSLRHSLLTPTLLSESSGVSQRPETLKKLLQSVREQGQRWTPRGEWWNYTLQVDNACQSGGLVLEWNPLALSLVQETHLEREQWLNRTEPFLLPCPAAVSSHFQLETADRLHLIRMQNTGTAVILSSLAASDYSQTTRRGRNQYGGRETDGILDYTGPDLRRSVLLHGPIPNRWSRCSEDPWVMHTLLFDGVSLRSQAGREQNSSWTQDLLLLSIKIDERSCQTGSGVTCFEQEDKWAKGRSAAVWKNSCRHKYDKTYWRRYWLIIWLCVAVRSLL